MLDTFGEAFAGIFLLIVMPTMMVVVPVGLVCAGIVYVLRKSHPAKSLITRLRWRLPLFLYSSSFAVASYFAMRSFFDTQDMGFLLAVGPGLVLTVSAPIAVVSAVLIIAKFLADRVVK